MWEKEEGSGQISKEADRTWESGTAHAGGIGDHGIGRKTVGRYRRRARYEGLQISYHKEKGRRTTVVGEKPGSPQRAYRSGRSGGKIWFMISSYKEQQSSPALSYYLCMVQQESKATSTQFRGCTPLPRSACIHQYSMQASTQAAEIERIRDK